MNHQAPTEQGQHRAMRAGLMTDFEIRRELETATDERRAALVKERAERTEYRAKWKPSQDGLLPVGFRGANKSLEDL
jgi:hypothetical protein